MSVKIRLRRMGAKKQPSYRIVVADSHSPRDGRFIEVIGHYNPRRNPTELVINHEKAREWLSKGAQPTDTVNRLFGTQGLPTRLRPALRRVGRVAGAPVVAESSATTSEEE